VARRVGPVQDVRHSQENSATVHFGLYKILHYFEAFEHESIILLSPPPTCIGPTIATRVHDYCAIYDALPTPLLYAIHHTILVIAISCKGQRALHPLFTASYSQRCSR